MNVLAEEHALAIEQASLLRGIFRDLALALMDWRHPQDHITRLEQYLPKGENE